jgi:DNA-binding response OmpR family regulator
VARILLVEDDPDVCPLLEHILLSEKHQVTVAETFDTGRRQVDVESYDLVLTDLRLGDGDGLDLADAAKAAGMRTLILSAYVLRCAPERLEQHRFLWKPVRVPELLRVVAEVLDQPA